MAQIAETTCFDRVLRDKKYVLEVNWSYLDISHQLTSFKLRQRDGTEQGKGKGIEQLRSKVRAGSPDTVQGHNFLGKGKITKLR